MGKFHIRPDAIDGERVRFDAEEARHLFRVLRLSPGAVIQAIDGTGMEYTVRMEEISPKVGIGTILLRTPSLTESPLILTLAQGVPKGDKMEWVVEKATELGVNRIIPLLTERVVIRLDPGRWRERARRWQRVAKESAKQAGRGEIPVVESPVPFADFSFQLEKVDLALCFWEGERRGLHEFLERRDAPPRSALLVVGPEGGLSLPEVETLRANGCPSVGLGPRILRTESAGLVGLSLLQYLYGDLGASPPGL